MTWTPATPTAATWAGNTGPLAADAQNTLSTENGFVLLWSDAAPDLWGAVSGGADGWVIL